MVVLKMSADLRRAATVEAVLGLAATNNPAEITTSQIAASMGVTQGALFRHFADKEAIWSQVFDWTADALFERLDRVSGASPIDVLRGIFTAHVDFVTEYWGVPRILFGELQRPGDTPGKRKVRALMFAYRSRVTSLLEEAQSARQIRADLDSSVAATLLLGMIQGLVMQAMASDDAESVREAAPRVFGLYLAGLGFSA